MRLLLDTHTFLWWLVDDPRLSPTARELLAEAENVVLVSAASGFEITNKMRLGKLRFDVEPGQLPVIVRQAGFRELSLTLEHAVAAGNLPGPHRDPFDRMLAAQAVCEGVPIVSIHAALRELGAQVLW